MVEFGADTTPRRCSRFSSSGWGCCSICRINAHAHPGIGVAGNLIPSFVILATYLVLPWLLSSTSMARSDVSSFRRGSSELLTTAA